MIREFGQKTPPRQPSPITTSTGASSRSRNVGNRLEIDPRRGSGANADGFSKMQEISTIGYDGLHRLTQVDYDLGTRQSEVFEYDDLGNRVTYQDERNSVTTLYTANEANAYPTGARQPASSGR